MKLNKLICIFLTLLWGCFISLPIFAADPPLPTPVGRVVWVKGTLKATMENKEERTLQKSSVIYVHDTLTTDSQSQAQIVFTDNTLMTFRQDTAFFINQYVYNPGPKKKSVGKYIMNLIQGGFRTITGIISKTNNTDYQINTPVATIGVRGTDYAVVLQNGHLKMAWYAGSPCMTAGQSTLCLSASTPYGEVPTVGAKPVPLKTRPEEFREKLQIIETTIGPFTGGIVNGAPSSGGGGGGTGGSNGSGGAASSGGGGGAGGNGSGGAASTGGSDTGIVGGENANSTFSNGTGSNLESNPNSGTNSKSNLLRNSTINDAISNFCITQ